MIPIEDLRSVTAKKGRLGKKKMSPLLKREARWGLVFLSPWMIGFVCLYLMPMLASLVFSLMDLNPATPELAHFVGLQNWARALFNDPEVGRSFLRTLNFAAISLPIGLCFALFLAILLNSKNVVSKNLFRTLFYMPAMIPMVATVLLWQGVLNEQTGWINIIIQRLTGIQAMGTEGIRWLSDPKLVYYAYTMFGLWGVGPAMVVFLAGLQGVPTELLEASELDGASWFQRLVRITIPMITPVIFYQLVLGVIGSLQTFLAPFVLNNGTGFPEGKTRFYMIYFYKTSFTFFNMGYGATLAWLMLIVALVITIILFGTAKYWVYYAAEDR